MDIFINEPNEKQKLFLADRHKHIAFGGARGGGKSWAVRTKAVLLALRYSGIKMLIVRRSYPELINNHINILKKETSHSAVYNDRDSEYGNSYISIEGDDIIFRFNGTRYFLSDIIDACGL